MTLNDKQIHEDPFLLLGFGMIAYRNLMWSLVTMFFILSMFSLPIIHIYSKGEGIKEF